MMPTNPFEALEEMVQDSGEARPFQRDPVLEAELLQRQRRELMETFTFRPGDLIEPKAGLQTTRYPGYGQPAIVVEVLDPPVFDTGDIDSGSPHFRTPLTLIIGVRCSHGTFRQYHVDGRLYRPWSMPVNLKAS